MYSIILITLAGMDYNVQPCFCMHRVLTASMGTGYKVRSSQVLLRVHTSIHADILHV